MTHPSHAAQSAGVAKFTPYKRPKYMKISRYAKAAKRARGDSSSSGEEMYPEQRLKPQFAILRGPGIPQDCLQTAKQCVHAERGGGKEGGRRAGGRRTIDAAGVNRRGGWW